MQSRRRTPRPVNTARRGARTARTPLGCRSRRRSQAVPASFVELAGRERNGWRGFHLGQPLDVLVDDLAGLLFGL